MYNNPTLSFANAFAAKATGVVTNKEETVRLAMHKSKIKRASKQMARSKS